MVGISVNYDGENINISMPVELLKHAMRHHPDTPLEVSNDDEFVRYYVNNFVEFDNTVNDDGLSNFWRLLDDFVIDMYESGGPVYDPSEVDGYEWE